MDPGHHEVVVDDQTVIMDLLVSGGRSGLPTVIQAANSAPVARVADLDLAPAGAADQPGERQADPALAVAGGLGGEAVLEHLRGEVGGHARAGVADHDLDHVAGLAHVDLHPADRGPPVRPGGRGDGVDAVLDEVAEHGGHVERRPRLQRLQGGARTDPQLHPALGRLRRLRHQQRGDRGVAYALGDGQVDGARGWPPARGRSVTTSS